MPAPLLRTLFADLSSVARWFRKQSPQVRRRKFAAARYSGGEALELRVVLSAGVFSEAANLVQFDFGTSGSPVAPGFQQVLPGTQYTTERGYGWEAGTDVTGRDRGASRGTELTRDLHFAPKATFLTDLPAGAYDVTVTMGDGSYDHNQMGIFIEGAHVGTVSTARGEFVEHTARVAVDDGQLTLLLENLGGGDPNIVVNGLQIAPVDVAFAAFDDAYELIAGSGTSVLDVLGNDVWRHESETQATITAVTQGSAGGAVQIVDGTSLEYTPNGGFTGVETFEYTVSDGTREVQATVTVTVHAAPVTELHVLFEEDHVLSLGGSQDRNGTLTLDPSYFGTTMRLDGNAWKRLQLEAPLTLTPETVLEFDFYSSKQGEVHSIGFGNSNALDSGHSFQLYGTQSWAWRNGIAPYGPDHEGSGWVHYRIPVGQYFTGKFEFLTFGNDHDVANSDAVSAFANVRIVEQQPLRQVVVESRSAFIDALRSAAPGTEILVAPGTYRGGLYFGNVRGELGAPIVIRALDPNNRPIFDNTGSSGGILQFSHARHLEIRDLIFQGGTGNGLNLDDGNEYGSSEHILIDNVWIRNLGDGNDDTLKISGVDWFRVTNSTFENWGPGGSAIDVVGGHFAFIENNTFRHTGVANGSGVQMKGGSSDIVVRRNYFENASVRAVQIGGSTGLKHFRPSAETINYEAARITVEHNVIVGSQAAVAFASSDGGIVRYNTIYRPGDWVFRILRENRTEGFGATRNGVIESNIIVTGSGLKTEINIGSGTAPETFQFSRNWWYDADNPSSSKPKLPSTEVDGVYAQDPLFRDVLGRDFRLVPESPADGYGAYAWL